MSKAAELRLFGLQIGGLADFSLLLSTWGNAVENASKTGENKTVPLFVLLELFTSSNSCRWLYGQNVSHGSYQLISIRISSYHFTKLKKLIYEYQRDELG